MVLNKLNNCNLIFKPSINYYFWAIIEKIFLFFLKPYRMLKRLIFFLRKKLLLVLFFGFVLGLLFTIYTHKVLEYTSTNESCEWCHVHPHATESWRLSSHYITSSGIHVGCVECHLPPKGQGYLKEKMIAAVRDVYGLVFKDSADYNWELKSTLEYAERHVFQESCVHCHQNLFPLTLTK